MSENYASNRGVEVCRRSVFALRLMDAGRVCVSLSKRLPCPLPMPS